MFFNKIYELKSALDIKKPDKSPSPFHGITILIKLALQLLGFEVISVSYHQHGNDDRQNAR